MAKLNTGQGYLTILLSCVCTCCSVLLCYHGIRFYRVRQPHIPADNASVSYHCLSPENSSSCVDYHIIPYIRMTFDLLYEDSIFACSKTLCPQSYMLVQFHVITDGACLPDNHTCSVVNKEAVSYRCSGMDIYAGITMD